MSTTLIWRRDTDSEGSINLYKLFGLCKGDSFTLIKQYYKILLLDNHPDKAHNQNEKLKRISMTQKLTAAYEILSDKEAREVYDKKGLGRAKRFLVKKLKKEELNREEEYARSVHRKKEERRRMVDEEEYQKLEDKKHRAKIAQEKREERKQIQFDIELERALRKEELIIKAREVKARHEAELVKKAAQKVLMAEQRERVKKEKEQERFDAKEKKQRESTLKINMKNIATMLQEIQSDIRKEKEAIEAEKKNEEDEIKIVYEEGLNVQRQEYARNVHAEIRSEKLKNKKRLDEKKRKIIEMKKKKRQHNHKKSIHKLKKQNFKLEKMLKKFQKKACNIGRRISTQ